MRLKGRLSGASRSLSDELMLTFIVDDAKTSEIEALGEIDIDISQHKDKYSDRALRYMWELCTLIARAIKSDKDTVYCLKLHDYGYFEDKTIIAEDYELQFEKYRFVDVIHHFNTLYLDNNGEEQEAEVMYIRGYFGCHTFNSQQMNEFISMIVMDAKDLGIDTWSEDEIEHYCSIWKAIK